MEAKHKHKKGVMIGYKNNQLATIDSREVAEMLGKEHSELLKEIEGRKDNKNVGIIPTLEKGNFHLSNYFIPSTYRSGTREYKCYLVTKMGCELLGNKQQGEKGILFTAKYVERFNEMEQAIKGQAKPLTTEEMLELQFKYAKEVKAEVIELKEDLNSFKEDLPLIGDEPDELVAIVRSKGTQVLGGKDSLAYKDKSLSRKIYSNIWKYVKEQFNVKKYKAIKRKYLEKAKEIVQAYEPPFYLKEEIIRINNQINFEEVI